MFKPNALVSLLALSLGAAACGDDPVTVDADASDSRADGGDDTADVSPDAGLDVDDTGDMGPDSVDTTPTCTPSGEVFEVPLVMSCADRLTIVLYGEDLNASACPPTWRFNDRSYPSAEALAAAEGCDARCVYRGTIGVDLIGCQSGSRTGYEVYEPMDAEAACLPAVYGTPIGLLADLCAWPEKACRADCNPACAEGTVGDEDARQRAATGVRRLSDTNLGQSFRAERAGILTGLELSLTRCDTANGASVTVLDGNGGEVAWAELDSAALSAGCDPMALSAGAPTAQYFPIEGACVAVDVGDTLTVLVMAPLCETPPCADGIGLGFSTGNPYTPGTLRVGETPVTQEDLTFKAFIE